MKHYIFCAAVLSAVMAMASMPAKAAGSQHYVLKHKPFTFNGKSHDVTVIDAR